MKHTLSFTFAAALLFALNATAQPSLPGANMIPKVMFGIKAGADFTEFSGPADSWQPAYKGGFTGGFFLGLHGKRWGFQPEVLVSSARFNYDLSTSNYVSTINLDVPVLLEYKLIPRLWLQLGPQFTDVLSKSGHNDYLNYSGAFNTADFSGVIGAQAILPLHLIIGARYVVGFSNLDGKPIVGISGSDATQTWNTRTFQLYIGFRFI